MRLSHFFIERPVFAVVVSVLIVLLGAIAYPTLPVAQYPEIVPPTVTVTANYPGASAETLAETVAEPIEEQINGVEKMLYMSSQSTGDGTMTITVTFELGTDLNQAQVLVENRVQVAEPRLPEQVRNTGVVVRKSSPDLLLAIHFTSPDGTLDRQYIGNYVTLNARDRILRVKGVGDVVLRGDRDFSIRVWIDPARAAARNVNASEITDAISRSNVQVAGGALNQAPTEGSGAYQLNIDTKGRLTDPEEFGDLVIKSDADGHVTRVRDVARVELGAQQYVTEAYLNEKDAVLLGVLQLPGSNALETAENVQKTLAELKKTFPPGLQAQIIYNPTEYVADSLREVRKTLAIALVLVILVVILFLQSWRAALVPVLAIPISLVGTFAVIKAAGFTLNNLSMFGLVLAIGIVVDDAIVVVENITRRMDEGSDPRKAAHETMDEVGSALVGIALVLTAVFVPAALIPGISGQFYRQFAITIATATLISLVVSLTLSPSIAALVMRAPDKKEGEEGDKEEPKGWRKPFAKAADYFNRGFDWLGDRYGRLIGRVVRLLLVMLLVYGGLIALAGWRMAATPTGFIPDQDQGNLIISARLPEGASLARTRAVSQQIVKAVEKAPGVKGISATVGFDATSNTNATNSIQDYVVLTPFKERNKHHLDIDAITADLEKRTAGILDADIKVIPPPPVRGIGTAGGFKLEVEDRGKKGYQALQQATDAVIAAAGGTQNSAIGSSGTTSSSASTGSASMEDDQKSGRPGGVAGGTDQVTTTGAASETGSAQDTTGTGGSALGGGSSGTDPSEAKNEKIDKSNVARVFTTYNTRTPRLHADIDRQKAEVLGVQDSQIFSTLQTYLASSYINDFNYLGRTFQVRAQADWPYRQTGDDLSQLKTRSSSGAMVPLGSLVTLRRTIGPYRVAHFNEYPAAEVQGSAGEGKSSGQAIKTMQAIAAKVLPAGFSYEWTEIAYQQTHTGNAAYVVFALAVVFAFLVLAALYESGTTPLAVLLIVPMCLLAAILGVNLRGMDNNILTQVGLIVLVGLAAKNAILIVEFAKQDEDAGQSPEDAAVHAGQTRLRPILMTSLAFILGVIPLAFAHGAGAEMRQALGTAVFFGMIGVTIFGLIFTPVFFVATRKLAGKLPEPKNKPSAGRPPQEEQQGERPDDKPQDKPEGGRKPPPPGAQPEPQT